MTLLNTEVFAFRTEGGCTSCISLDECFWYGIEQLDAYHVRVREVHAPCCNRRVALATGPGRCRQCDGAGATVYHHPELQRFLSSGLYPDKIHPGGAGWYCEPCAFWRVNWKETDGL